jgi:hypothetical protein
VWTLWHQEGFPLEMSDLTVRTEHGCKVDWAEAMYDASRSDNCPALMDHLSTFLGEETLTQLKLGYMKAVRSGKSWDELLASKRSNGKAFIDHMERVNTALRTALEIRRQGQLNLL